MLTKSQLTSTVRYTEVAGVKLRALTELDRINLRGLWGRRVAAIDASDDVARAAHYYSQCVELLAISIVGEDGKRMFEDSELDLIKQIDVQIFDKAADVAWDFSFNGNDRKEVDSYEKKSADPDDTK